MISCGHCGGRHATVAEVRDCALGRGDGAEPGPVEPGPGPVEPAPAPSGPSPAPHGRIDPVVLAPDWARLAGPDPLGRSIVVAPDAAAPPPWDRAERVVIDGDPESSTRLRAAWAGRQRLVIELADGLPDPEPVLDVDFWHLDPDTDLPGETIAQLVFDHAVDARNPGAPTLRPVSLAVAAGATVAHDGPGDIVTPDGPAWCDGGPLDWFDDHDLGAGVVPMVHLQIGSLSPIRHAAPDADLAPDQLAAVAHGGGGARIVAPAGSGKTRVLTERARHLVRDRGIDPSTICLVAFNVRAREEMQQRTTDLPGIEIRTLNSLALAILTGRGPFRPPAGRRAPRVIDEREVRRALDDLVPGRRRQAMADPMAAWIEALTASRLGLRDPAAVEREFGGDVKGFAEVVPTLRARYHTDGVVDFDEQILGAVEVLLRDPAARAAARRACGLLLVDEFQDLTPAHVLLVRLLAGPRADVFGVGDDDQTIYGYAGASPEWLLDFAELFPGSATHDLTVNYRCPPTVIERARTLLGHNRRRIDKAIHAAPDRGDDGDAFGVCDGDPLDAAVGRVAELLDAGVAPRDIAILTRVNATLLGPMIALAERGIATTTPLDPSFLDRTGVAGALAWLELAGAPARRLSGAALETAVRRPPRGISPRLAGWVGEQASVPEIRRLASRLSQPRDADRIEAFADDLDTLRDMADDGADTGALLAAVRDRVGLGAALDNRLDASRRSVDRSAHGDDLAALIAVAAHQPDPAGFRRWLADRLAAEPDWSGVRLSTIHRVKGREWPHVIVHEATAGLLPHRLAADREEERRVFHVALTRGAESVRVTAGDPASPFIAELTTPSDPSLDPPEPPRRPMSDTGGAAASEKRRGARAVPPADSLGEARLRERLKAWRGERARADGVPAYIVFNDVTLYELAARRPLTDDELLDITGIGPTKLEKYGAEILATIGAFIDENPA